MKFGIFGLGEETLQVGALGLQFRDSAAGELRLGTQAGIDISYRVHVQAEGEKHDSCDRGYQACHDHETPVRFLRFSR
jgi:hypothetical protein